MGRIQKAIAAIYAEKQKLGKIRQQDLAKALGCSQATVSHIINGSRTLSEKWIESLCEQLDITLADIEQEKSHLLDTKELREAIEKLRDLYKTRPEVAFRNVDRSINDWLQVLQSIQDFRRDSNANSIELPEPARVEDPPVKYMNIDAPRPVDWVQVPYYDSIPAGDPREMSPESRTRDIVHSDARDTWYTLRVSGDSMSPEYVNGDIVLMDYALEPHNGDVVAALIDGQDSTLKIYSRQGDEITLTPIETKQHTPRAFHASRVRIQGVAIEIVRRVVRRKKMSALSQ
jgi:SOS-response transcriptional repressor LexA